jgi:cellulose synthase (UDP-forming)
MVLPAFLQPDGQDLQLLPGGTVSFKHVKMCLSLSRRWLLSGSLRPGRELNIISKRVFSMNLYEQSIQLALTFVAVLIALVLWRKGSRMPLLIVAIALQVRYLLWRGLFTLDTVTLTGLTITMTLFIAESYGLLQNLFFSYQSAGSSHRIAPQSRRHPTVDIFVPIVDEPLEILHRTLIGCLAQDYPRDRFTVHVLDDGRREDVRGLARDIGCNYLRRRDRTNAKAGNLNHALSQTTGELVAIFDVDHVPVRNFLVRTIGFFDDDSVAFMQTPHYFYNPDVFQKNLHLEREIRNDQDLFFRVIQPGRDRHNSAFFAGSSGVFRRAALEQIGGFRTNTLTEDLTTSLVLHSRGWKSRYLDEVLSAGLTPESHRSYLRQKERWAMGAVQTFLRENPLLKKGLSCMQRIDYFASIYYFLNGMPRIIYLAAPLSFLLLGIAPIRAQPLDLIHYFLSYYFVSVLSVEVAGKGYRRLFWSDVYETMMSFTLTGAAIKALLPTSQSTFHVTPKGTARIQERSWKEAFPLLVLFASLLAGIGLAIVQKPENRGAYFISIVWASFNALLLLIAIVSSLERPQRRRLIRLRKTIPCVVRSSGMEVAGHTVDISEEGASVRIGQRYFSDTRMSLELKSSYGEVTSVSGDIMRQEEEADGNVIGIRFRDIDVATYRSLIRQMYSPPDSWSEKEINTRRLARDILLPIIGVLRHLRKDKEKKRRHPRLPIEMDCLYVKGRDALDSVAAQTLDISFSGLSILIRNGEDMIHAGEDGLLRIEGIDLQVIVVASERMKKGLKLHLKINAILEGEEKWKSLSLPSS